MPSCVVHCVRKRFPLEKNHEEFESFHWGWWRYSYVVFLLKWIYFLAEWISRIRSFQFFMWIRFLGWEILHYMQIIFRENAKIFWKPPIYLRYNPPNLLNPLKVYLYMLLSTCSVTGITQKLFISNYFLWSLQPFLILRCKDHWLN